MPRTMASSGAPPASAAVTAASALCKLCAPGACNANSAAPAGVWARSIQWSSTHKASPVTSAAPLRANVSCARDPAWRRQTAACASSAGYTATPDGGSASIALPFSIATASTLAMNSWCSRWALLTSTTVGAAICASPSISPGWFMPSSSTAARCQWESSWRSRSTINGTPMWLFRLPLVANAASPHHARRMLAIICVTVVLPLLPVTAINGRCMRRRQPAAICCRPCRLSATNKPGKASAARPRSASAATAPAPRACCRKSCASKRSPRSATNRSPARSVRVSLCTRSNRTAPSPTTAEPGTSACACASVIMWPPWR